LHIVAPVAHRTAQIPDEIRGVSAKTGDAPQ
jgi:hypothetical protein